MLFEGIFGTWGASRGFLAAAAAVAEGCRESGRAGVPPGPGLDNCERARCTTSGWPVFIGGGNGEIETVVTEAEWAW